MSRGTPSFRVLGPDVVTGDGTKLPPGQVTAHIRNLILKAGLQGHHRLDQTLLLRGLADALRGPNQLGPFASDALMKLGLLGTIIGFILMLAPIAGLDAADRASVKSSMGLMSDGMAVAMYTTLTGLIGSVLVQTQYYMLDEATAKVFGLATDLTEVFVVSVLEQEPAARSTRLARGRAATGKSGAAQDEPAVARKAEAGGGWTASATIRARSSIPSA